MNIMKKTVLTTAAIASLSVAIMGATATGASAGWKKHKHFHWHAKHRFYNHGYYCKPKYRKIWVWSPRHGHKIKRWVKVGKWCNGRYISLY